MSDPALGLLMLTLIVVVIMMGFPTALTLMGIGIFFGFIAFYDPTQSWAHNRVFDLMVERTYGAMTNDVLISIPLFVLMGYVMERCTLGILLPPSVMIIVYAAVAGQSVVKLYAAAMFPGFFLSFLYLVYVIGWAMINPKIAPKLPEEQTKVPVPAWMR